MFKNKIAKKLSLYFAAALLIFSIVISGVFMALFRNHTLTIHRNELLNRANSISNTLSAFLRQGGMGMGMGMGMSGQGAYLRFLNEIAGTDVWIVDENLNLLTGGMGHGGAGMHYTYSDLPKNADQLIRQVFEDKAVFSEDFSGILSEPTLTVGVPIKSGGQILGVVLLHSPVRGINAAIAQGFLLIGISILVAMGIGVLLSVGFSVTFTKPLNKIKDTALQIAEGDYNIRTQVSQKDEIGQLAQTLDLLSSRLYDASRQSERLEQMRRDFVANVSHELRTPVTVLRGSLEALTEKVVADPIKVEEYHQQMLQETIHLQRLVGDLLDLSRLQNTDFAIERQEVSLCDLIDDVTRGISQVAKEKGVQIQATKEVCPCIIQGDYGRLRQMLLILLDNAVKFSAPSSAVEVILKEHSLSVRDHGPGIYVEELPYIFDRFYKSRPEQNKSGTGLGLAIAKQIAQRHEMELTAQNNTDGGATFLITF